MASVISFKEAKVLAQDPHSCVKIENVNRKVNLSYKYIDCAKKGIQEILDNELNLFTESLDGAMIAYQKVRLRQHMGRIVECQPFIQFNVQVDVAVFRPYPGAMMKGVINKIGNDHIGLLIHNIFNGSLRRPKDLEVKLSVGQEVWFKIWKVYQHGGLTAVRGDLDIDSIGAETVPEVATDLLPLSSSGTKIPEEDALDAAASSSSDSKKRKRKRTMSGTAEMDTSVSAEKEEETGFLSPTSEKKRKKRKKDKGVEEAGESAHKQKKRKRSVSISDLEVSAVSTADEGQSTPSEKKRKRRKENNLEESNESLIGESATSEALGQSFIGSPPILILTDGLKVESKVLASTSPKKKLKFKKKDKDMTELTSTPVRAGPSTEINAETPGLNETSLPGGLLNESVDQTDSPMSSKKHKKKKKKKSKDSELDSTLNDSIISVEKSDVFAGSDSGISDSTPQSLPNSAKKTKKKKKSKGDTSVAIASPSNAMDS